MTLLDSLGNSFSAASRVLNTIRIFGSRGGELLTALTLQSPEAPRILRETFEELGATYIKLGQLIASAPGLFPEPYVREMQRCFDQAKPLPFRDIRRVLDREFNNRTDDIFASIDPSPLASASIAQVHAARLRSGEDVVIKVQRPGIEDILMADMNLILIATFLFEKITTKNGAGLTDIVKMFQETIAEEIDFIRESANLEEFRDFLNSIGETRVVAPKVYRQYTTRHVLTMERLYGRSLTDLGAVRRYSGNPKETLVIALNTWTLSLMHCGFFHADVHAGNLMILEDGRVAFIDFGIVGRMSEKIWNSLLGLVQALGTEDYELMAESLVGMNATHDAVNIPQFAAELKKIFNDFSTLGAQVANNEMLDEDRLNEMMMHLSNVAQKNGLKIPREFGLLFKQMLYFDRYVRILAPEMNLATSPEFQLGKRPMLPSANSNKKK